MSLRNVLFIAYNFPPHGGAGVQRSLKFVKYLPEFGWQPWVITTLPSATIVSDPSQLAEIPDQTPIIRTPGFSIQALIAKPRPYPINRFTVLLNLLLQVPDPGIFWARNAYHTITLLIEKAKPDIVYTTSSPYSAHLLGLRLKRAFLLPWFADFRDPWSSNLVIPYLPGYRWINKVMERRVLENADTIASVSAPWLEDLYNCLGREKQKFTLIHNGFDEHDIKITHPEFSAPFIISYFGSLTRNRDPNNIVRAIVNLIQRGEISASDIQLRFIGKDIQGCLPGYPWISEFGYITHAELQNFRSDTDLFLLILDCSPENVGNYSGKLYEYMASNRPILAVVPPSGVAQQLVLESNTGIAVDNNIQDIENAILKLYGEWQQGYPNWAPNWEVINRYTRRKQTEQLAQEFEYLASIRGRE